MRPSEHHSLFALGHSMGGAILAKYLLDYPTVFHAAAFTSPMFQINYPGLSEWVAEILATVGPSEWSSSFWCDLWADAPGCKPPLQEYPFETNPSTTSAMRYAMLQRMVTLFPETALGEATFGWLEESIAATKEIRERAAELETPMLLLQATDDQVVVPEAQTQACQQAADCELIKMVGSRHSVLMERDILRTEAMQEVLRFFAKQVKGAGGANVDR